jgi:hypothetical protein
MPVHPEAATAQLQPGPTLLLHAALLLLLLVLSPLLLLLVCPLL